MEKENIQKELFEFEAPKKQPRRFGQLFQKTDFAVSLSAERLVFVSIGIIMLLVVAFALGVERGKSVSSAQAQPKAAIAAQSAAQPKAVPIAPVAVAATPVAPAQKMVPPAVTAVKRSPVQAQPKAVEDKGKPYTIVAAAFSKEALALAAVSRMKASGIEAFVYRSEPYYLACVGAFANKESAQKTLIRVKQMHRDAYVRLK